MIIINIFKKNFTRQSRYQTKVSGAKEISEYCTDFISPELHGTCSLDNPETHLFNIPPEGGALRGTHG